jgi:hypothetical protein
MVGPRLTSAEQVDRGAEGQREPGEHPELEQEVMELLAGR